MKVRCLTTSLNDEQKQQLGIEYKTTSDHQIIPGNSYLVLGITFMLPVEFHGGGVHYQILNDFGNCRSIPACLFEVEDARCSRHWTAKQDLDGSLLLWPEEFFTQFFHDDLSEGEFEAVETFKKVVARMQFEFPEQA